MRRALHAFCAVLLLLPFGAAAAKSVAAGRLKPGYALCRDQASLSSLLKASIAKDEKGFKRIMAKSCRASRGGERVRRLASPSPFLALAIHGRRGTWWTVSEALR